MHFSVGNILFLVLLIAGIVLFTINVRKVIRNIRLGRDADRSDRKGERFSTMMRVAFGQTKMMVRPLPGILHFFVYAGFIIINIEVLEILIDGVFGTHRVLSFTGGLYSFLIAAFEWLALFVLLGCLIFLLRRDVARVKRLVMGELKGFPITDAHVILITEILLMSAFLLMNASDYTLQQRELDHYMPLSQSAFPVSSILSPMLSGLSNDSLVMIERGTWWFHIIGIIAFLNYLPYSKHFHIILAFPNTYYSKLSPKAQFDNVQAVTNEVKLMLDPSAVPPAADAPPARFGAKDVQDLTWKQLMDAYSCTECGRCTSACPANQTGKLLSPRHIMMGTRDRLEEVGKNIDKNGKEHDDGKSLLSHISPEELWACTSCQACIQECPVNIDPLSIIIDMRRYLVMEQSAAPAELNMMFTNTENNGAPWQMSPADRFNWANES
jgi:heterodisulfide reductase subunit C